MGMECPLIQQRLPPLPLLPAPPLPQLRYSLAPSSSKPLPCSPSCQCPASAINATPPILSMIHPHPPGAGRCHCPLASPSLQTFLLGCYQASPPPNFAGLDLDHLTNCYRHALWCIPTFPSHDSHHHLPSKITSQLQHHLRSLTHCTNNTCDLTLRRSEIAFPPSRTGPPNIWSDPNNDTNQVDDLSLSPASSQQLEPYPLISLSDAHLLNMTTTITSVPGSPPDLSGSRSSKSSSLSSTFSSPDGLESDVTNFEEIGLDDDKQNPLPRSYHSRDVSMQSVGSQHELIKSQEPVHGERRPQLPQLQTQVKPASQRQDWVSPRNPPAKMVTMKRGFTSPETFFPTSMRTRSSSPPTRRVVASSSTVPVSAGGLRPIPQSPASFLGVPSRRSSWQPQRKTIKELEDEYHDSDDELPDDASLWNVPVSPHISGQRSHRSSFRGSPDRASMSQSPGPIPLAHAKTAPDTPPRPTMHSQSLPKNRSHGSRTVSLNPSASNPSSPRRTNPLRNGRTKSWNLAMADLSEEARIISETLQYHAEIREQARSASPQGNGSSDSLALPKVGESRKNSIQLPPIQKSTLDFMPISKEKEAILSRTRPSWLPPKNPKEEAKHLKEYQAMMAASLESEKKRRIKLQAQQCAKDDTRESLNRIWTYYAEETTDLKAIDQRVYDLCWRGVSPNLRGKVWQRTVGNPLGLTVKSYEKALQRAKEIKKKPWDQLDRNARSMGRWFVDIERDAETAFPELNLFQRHCPMWQDLVNVCEAYACYRSDVGYIYGMQLIAALLLLQISTPADAFILMANCLNRPAPLAFQINDTASTSRIYNHAVSTLGIKFPRLHEYLFGSLEQGGLGFTGEEVFEPMFRTIFSNGLDVDRLCRVWDIWIFEGDRSLVQAAVAILGSLQSQIFDIRGDIHLKRRNAQEMLGWGPFNRAPKSGHWNLQTVGNEENFVEEVRLAGTLAPGIVSF